ncbi:hypothetical protein ABPG74_003085 [Tetrahymena malaccensis]
MANFIFLTALICLMIKNTIQELESEGQSLKIKYDNDFIQTRNLDSSVLKNSPRSSLNNDVININPLLFKMYSQEEIQENGGELKLQSKIFDFPSQTIANITFDMRQMKHTYKDDSGDIFTFGEDWVFCVIMSESLQLDDSSYQCIDLPQKLVDSLKQPTDNIHKFNLYSMKDQKLMVLIRIFNSKYFSLRLNFLNSVGVSLESPKRAVYDENVSFIFYINQKQQTIPVNAINLDKQLQIGDYLISYEQNYYNQLPLEQNNLTQTNAVLNADTYFSNLKGVFMPYIPYFSNCRQFGSMGFFYQITENPENCNLVSPQNIKVIDPFVFGDTPYSDECENISYDCVLDEYMYFPFTQDLWYRLQKEQTLFSMKAEPIQFNSQEVNSNEISIDDLVEIQVDSEVPENKLPKKISLQINYYQISNTEKQIINGLVNFENFITPTDDQANGKAPFNYTLQISFHSMTQSELTIAFALDIRVYLIMYFIIGFFSLISICIFTGYHIAFRRSKNKFQTKVMECIQTIYPSAIYGTFLTIFPLGIILFLNLAIMGGRFWDLPFNIYGCDPKTDLCQLSIFDSYKDEEISFSDDEMTNLRNGRYGLSIIIIGLYIMYTCSDLLIYQNKTKEEQQLDQYTIDGNSWLKRFWEKSYFMLFYFFMIIVMEIIIQWSISTNFGENVWYYLCTLKILGMLSEILGSKFFSKKILSAPIAYGLDCTLDVATLGANDFIDFLLSFFIEQGIQMIERAYLCVIMKEVEEFIDVALESQEAKQNEEQQDALLNLSLIQQGDDEQTLNNSSVYFSDNFEESFESLFQNQGSEIDKDQKRKKNKLKMQSDIHRQTKNSQEQLNSSFDENNETDLNESYFKNLLDSKLQGQQLNRKNQSQIHAKDKTNNLNNKKQNIYSQKNHEIDTDSDEVIDRYADYINGMIGPLVLPIITSQCWIFYEQNLIANAYNIERESYIYYFLFTVIILPFRLAIDIVYYHLWVGYHDIDFLEYAKKTQKRFKLRKQIWKANDPSIDSESEGEESQEQMQINQTQKKKNRKIDEELVDLDRWCFSSQFYFVHNLFLIGMMNCVFGIYNITSTQHNLFKDQMTFPIILLWIILCYFVHKLCIIGGKFLGIWKIKQNHETKIEEIAKCEDLEQNIQHKNQQAKVKIIQKEKQQMKAKNYINLKKSQLENPNFRKNFIQSNKYWLRSNISKVLNKETKQKYRDLILEQMESINLKLKKRSDFKHYLLMKKMKKIKQNLFMAENKESLLNNSKNSNIQNQSDQEFDDYMLNLEENYYLQEQQRESLFSLEAQMKPNRPSDIPNSTKILIKYWLYRSKNYTKACALVGGVFDKKIKQYCQFCGNNWGLTCLPEQNVEDLFLKYIRKMKIKNVMTDKQKDGWQDYFQEQCQFRTECFDCNQLAAENFQKICNENKIKTHLVDKFGLNQNQNQNKSHQFLLELQQDQNSQNLFGSIVENRDDYTPINEVEEQKYQQQIANAKQLEVKQYQIQPKKFQDQSQNKLLGLRRMNQITPASTQRDSYQDLSFIISNKSTSRQPFISQQTNELTNTQIPISEINLDKVSNKFQKYQRNFIESTMQQNYLQSEKFISDIQLNSFAENQTLFNDEDNIKLSNRSYNVFSSINKFDDCESKLDTSRGQLQKMQDFQAKDTISLSRLLVSQNTCEIQTDDAYTNTNKHIKKFKNQIQVFEDFKNERTFIGNNKLNQKQTMNQNLILQLKLSKLVRQWKQQAQSRLYNKN